LDESGKLIVEYKTDDVPRGLTKLVSVYKFAVEKIIEKHGVERFIQLSEKFKQDRTKIDSEVVVTEDDIDVYYASNINEFITGIFFDDTFRKEIGEMEYKASGVSLLRSFAEALLKMFQSIFTGNNTVAQHTVDALVDLLESQSQVKTVPNPMNTQTIDVTNMETDRMAEGLLEEDFRIIDVNEVIELIDKKGFSSGIMSFIQNGEMIEGVGQKMDIPGYGDLGLFVYRMDDSMYVINNKTKQILFKTTTAATFLETVREFIEYANKMITNTTVEVFEDILTRSYDEITPDIPLFMQGDVDDVEEC
jgi:hypothetical protein